MRTLDWLILIASGIFGVVVFLFGLVLGAIVLWWMRRIDGHDEIVRRQRRLARPQWWRARA